LIKKNLLTSKLDLELRKRIAKPRCGVLLCMERRQARTMTQNHRKKIEAFAMWIWRKMLDA